MKSDLKIIVWNCFRGRPHERFADLAALGPDIAVLTEARAPSERSARIAWAATSDKLGIAVVTSNEYTVERLPMPVVATRSAVPFRVAGPTNFNLLAVWTVQEPTYARAMGAVLDAYEPLVRSSPTVVAGDFNSNPIWDRDSKTVNHSVNDRRLRQCGLKSAYHACTGEIPGSESMPTLYHLWKQDRGSHIDYCYVPAGWHVRGAIVAPFDAFTASDHRPLPVTFAVPAGGTS